MNPTRRTPNRTLVSTRRTGTCYPRTRDSHGRGRTWRAGRTRVCSVWVETMDTKERCYCRREIQVVTVNLDDYVNQTFDERSHCLIRCTTFLYLYPDHDSFFSNYMVMANNQNLWNNTPSNSPIGFGGPEAQRRLNAEKAAWANKLEKVMVTRAKAAARAAIERGGNKQAGIAAGNAVVNAMIKKANTVMNTKAIGPNSGYSYVINIARHETRSEANAALRNRQLRGNANVPQNVRQALAGTKLMDKITDIQRKLVAAAKAAQQGMKPRAKQFAETARKWASEAYAMAPDRQVVKEYIKKLGGMARRILEKIQVGVAAIVAKRRALQPARSVNNSSNIQRQLNRIGVASLQNSNITLSKLSNLSDRVPEFFMMKQMLAHINASETARNKSSVLLRIKQWLKVMKYYKDADARVTTMLNHYPLTNNAALSQAALTAMQLYSPNNYTPCHYEYLAINIPGASNLVNAKKQYMKSVRITISTAAKTFREVYNRVANKDEMVNYFVKTYGAAVSGFPCVDRGITSLLDVAVQTDRRFPANRGNANTWAGARVNITRQNGALTNHGRRVLRERVLQPYMSKRLELNASAFNNRHKLWNAVKNKNLKINGQIRKVANIGRNEINNYYKVLYGE